jgi:hypothetical protein
MTNPEVITIGGQLHEASWQRRRPSMASLPDARLVKK